MSNDPLTPQQAAANLIKLISTKKKDKELQHQALAKEYESLFSTLKLIKGELDSLDISWSEYNIPLYTKLKHTKLTMQCAGFYYADIVNSYIITKDGELLLLLKDEYLLFNHANLVEFDAGCDGATSALVTLSEALTLELGAAAANTTVKPARQLE